MSRPRLQVHHWLVAKLVRTYGSIPEADLLGVSHHHPIPADTEFPKSRRPFVMFLRVLASEAGLTDFIVQVHWQMGSGDWKQTTHFSDPGRPLVFPLDKEVVYADWIQLPYATLEGYGLYAVTIYFRRIEPDDEEDRTATPEAGEWEEPDDEEDRTATPEAGEWEEPDDDATPVDAVPMPWDPAESGWVFGAVDYFYVVNQ